MAGVPVTAGAQDTPVVAMGNAYFDPIGLFVEPGTTVRFEIEAGSHSATAYPDRIPSGATSFDSTTFSSGAFEHTFETPGTYDYYCIPHQSMGMVGRIVVGEPGGPAEDSPIPDGAVPESGTIVEQGTVPIDDFDEAGGGRGGMMGSNGGMMGSNGGMMGGSWLMMLMPIGILTVVLSLIGGITYWATNLANSRSSGPDSAMAALREQYARGEIDEEEFERRRKRLREVK